MNYLNTHYGIDIQNSSRIMYIIANLDKYVFKKQTRNG